MVDNFIIAVIIGATLGFLAGLGVGGGNLLILWLTLIVGFEYAIAKGINLLFFLPTAIIATIFRWKKGSLPLAKTIPAIIGGCISATLLSFVSKNIQPELINKLFGWLLIITGLRELFYRPRKAK